MTTNKRKERVRMKSTELKAADRSKGRNKKLSLALSNVNVISIPDKSCKGGAGVQKGKNLTRVVLRVHRSQAW
jgi:hypothetical protein